jgi:tetratricopeptide (TPR) repeat protein
MSRQMKDGRYSEALSLCDRILATADDFDIQYSRALALYQLKRYEESAAALGTLLARKPGNAELHYLRGYALHFMGHYALAQADFDQAVAQQPSHAQYVLGRAQTWLARGRFVEALADLNTAIALQPDDASLYVYRAATHYDLGDYLDAIRDASRALELGYRRVRPYMIRGKAAQMLGRLAESIADFDEVISLDRRDSEAYALRGSSHASLQRWDEALRDYSAALKINPAQPDVLFRRGVVYLWRAAPGDILEARRDFSELLRLDGTLVDAHLYRAIAYYGLKKLDRALEDLWTYINFDYVHGHQELMANQWLIVVQMSLGKTDDARDHVRMVQAFHPDLASTPNTTPLWGAAEDSLLQRAFGLL